jgi:hypothetical protein
MSNNNTASNDVQSLQEQIKQLIQSSDNSNSIESISNLDNHLDSDNLNLASCTAALSDLLFFSFTKLYDETVAEKKILNVELGIDNNRINQNNPIIQGLQRIINKIKLSPFNPQVFLAISLVIIEKIKTLKDNQSHNNNSNLFSAAARYNYYVYYMEYVSKNHAELSQLFSDNPPIAIQSKCSNYADLFISCVILGLIDYWSAVRRCVNKQLQLLLLNSSLLSNERVQLMTQRLIDELKLVSADWQQQEGCIAALTSILQYYCKQTVLRQDSLVFIHKEILPPFYQFISHNQLTIREYVSQAFSYFIILDKSDENLINLCNYFIQRLNNNNSESIFLPDFESEGILGVLGILLNAANVAIIQSKFHDYYSVIEYYLGHSASTVRQQASQLLLTLAHKHQPFMINIFQTLTKSFKTRIPAKSQQAEANGEGKHHSQEISNYFHGDDVIDTLEAAVYFSIPPNYSLPRKAKQAVVTSSTVCNTWQWKEGCLMTLESFYEDWNNGHNIDVKKVVPREILQDNLILNSLCSLSGRWELRRISNQGLMQLIPLLASTDCKFLIQFIQAQLSPEKHFLDNMIGLLCIKIVVNYLSASNSHQLGNIPTAARATNPQHLAVIQEDNLQFHTVNKSNLFAEFNQKIAQFLRSILTIVQDYEGRKSSTAGLFESEFISSALFVSFEQFYLLAATVIISSIGLFWDQQQSSAFEKESSALIAAAFNFIVENLGQLHSIIPNQSSDDFNGVLSPTAVTMNIKLQSILNKRAKKAEQWLINHIHSFLPNFTNLINQHELRAALIPIFCDYFDAESENDIRLHLVRAIAHLLGNNQLQESRQHVDHSDSCWRIIFKVLANINSMSNLINLGIYQFHYTLQMAASLLSSNQTLLEDKKHRVEFLQSLAKVIHTIIKPNLTGEATDNDNNANASVDDDWDNWDEDNSKITEVISPLHRSNTFIADVTINQNPGLSQLLPFTHEINSFLATLLHNNKATSADGSIAEFDWLIDWYSKNQDSNERSFEQRGATAAVAFTPLTRSPAHRTTNPL